MGVPFGFSNSLNVSNLQRDKCNGTSTNIECYTLDEEMYE